MAIAGERRPSAGHEAAGAPESIVDVERLLAPEGDVARTLRPVDGDAARPADAADVGATVESPDEDGRRARRERNRSTVVESLLELFSEGNLAPSSDEIAERAGLSARSLFRYFDDVDDLAREAIVRQRDRLLPLVPIDVPSTASLHDRVVALVEQRVRLFDAMGPVGQVSRLRAPFRPLIAAELSLHRSFLRKQLQRLFRAELAALEPSVAAGVLAMLDVMCSFESYQLLRRDQMLTRELATAAMTDSVERVLASA